MRRHLGKRPSPSMGVALIALFIALGGTTYAATGGNFVLGQENTATTPSSLSAPVAGGKVLELTNTDSAAGSNALGLSVAAGKAPFTVNSSGKVMNLNADRLDGQDASRFALQAQERWHEIGTPGERQFQYSPGFPPGNPPEWKNYGNGFNTVAFYKDSLGIVHLKGRVQWARASSGLGKSCDLWTIFQLPAGYHPAAYGSFPAFKNSQPTRIDVGNNGWVFLCTATEDTVNGDWFSLDGISFRAAG